MEPARASAMVEEARRRAERIAAALGARARDDARDSGAGDANEIDLDARATTRETRGTGTAVGTLAMRAQRANAGVAGLYRAVEATTTRAAREPPRAYVERRLERFDRDVRGYDASASAKSMLEHDERARASERGRAGTAAATTRAAPTANARETDGPARAGLGSRPTDASIGGDEIYALYRANRAYREPAGRR